MVSASSSNVGGSGAAAGSSARPCRDAPSGRPSGGCGENIEELQAQSARASWRWRREAPAAAPAPPPVLEAAAGIGARAIVVCRTHTGRYARDTFLRLVVIDEQTKILHAAAAAAADGAKRRERARGCGGAPAGKQRRAGGGGGRTHIHRLGRVEDGLDVGLIERVGGSHRPVREDLFNSRRVQQHLCAAPGQAGGASEEEEGNAPEVQISTIGGQQNRAGRQHS